VRAVFQVACGFRITKTSEISTPIGSVAISARPVFDTTVSTSGNCRNTRSSSVVCRTDSSSEMLGRRIA
jgi:hypothetical protein